MKLDTFTRHYVVAALWTSDPSPGQGDYEQKGLALVRDVSDAWLEQAAKDCAKFQEENAELLEQAGTDAQNGHDFWLTRNRHGAGFWDRGYDDLVGKALALEAHAFGEAYLDWEFDLNRE